MKKRIFVLTLLALCMYAFAQKQVVFMTTETIPASVLTEDIFTGFDTANGKMEIFWEDWGFGSDFIIEIFCGENNLVALWRFQYALLSFDEGPAKAIFISAVVPDLRFYHSPEYEAELTQDFPGGYFVFKKGSSRTPAFDYYIIGFDRIMRMNRRSDSYNYNHVQINHPWEPVETFLLKNEAKNGEYDWVSFDTATFKLTYPKNFYQARSGEKVRVYFSDNDKSGYYLEMERPSR